MARFHIIIARAGGACRGRDLRLEQDVGGLDVPVDQAVRVRSIKCRRDLGYDQPGVAERKRPEPVEQGPCVPPRTSRVAAKSVWSAAAS